MVIMPSSRRGRHQKNQTDCRGGSDDEDGRMEWGGLGMAGWISVRYDGLGAGGSAGVAD